MSMEAAEELAEREEKNCRITWDVFVEELKKVSSIAAPMVAVTVLQYLLQVISFMMVGHLEELSLSSVATATALTNVTGFSLLSGLVGGLETLCGQAYGARQYRKVGVYTYSAIISLCLVFLPISAVWIFLDKLLILIGQDPSISIEARNYSIWVIPALFGSAIVKPLVRHLQSQSLISPLLISSLVVLCFHGPLSWAFIFKFKFGSIGAAIAFSLSNCLKWWSLEVLILLSGLLPNPKLETSVLSICLTISTLHFTIPYGIGVAASTRVSNELGAGNTQGVRVAVWTVMFLAVVETVVVSTSLFGCRYILGRAYSNDKEVVDYVAVITPLICLSTLTDSIQAVISGIARGSGWQKLGAYVNLVSFYLVGIPIAVVLGFRLHMNAKGFWIGIVVGSAIQGFLLFLITIFTNRQKQEVNYSGGEKRVMEEALLAVEEDYRPESSTTSAEMSVSRLLLEGVSGEIQNAIQKF